MITVSNTTSCSWQFHFTSNAALGNAETKRMIVRNCWQLKVIMNWIVRNCWQWKVIMNCKFSYNTSTLSLLS